MVARMRSIQTPVVRVDSFTAMSIRSCLKQLKAFLKSSFNNTCLLVILWMYRHVV